MIRIIFVLAGTWACTQGFSQGNPEAAINLERLNKLRGNEKDIVVPWRGQNPVAANVKILTPVFVGSNGLGEIYELPQDNMPMLKPYQQNENVMPGTEGQVRPETADKPGKIPNAIPPKIYRFIPNKPTQEK
jgi:hypothetical protein